METLRTVELCTPCRKCGGTTRYRSNRNCVSCARARAMKLRQESPDDHVLQQTRYRRRWFTKRATPPWADLEAIRRIEEDAERLSTQMGLPMHVVHEIPLRGRTVCGLHVEHNLKVVSQSWKNLRRFSTKKAAEEQMEWLRERGLSPRVSQERRYRSPRRSRLDPLQGHEPE